jgi:hypothetical protein
LGGDVCVFQVLGRVRGYSEVVFELGGSSFRAFLLGDALCGFWGGGCRLVLLVPESVAVQLAGSAGDLRRLASSWDELGEAVIDAARKHVRWADKLEAVVLPSYGIYLGGAGDRRCKVDYRGVGRGDVELAEFLALVERLPPIAEEPCRRIAIDVTTGHNVYIAALARALRSAVVGFKLAHLDVLLLDGSWPPVEFAVASAPPIVQGRDGPYPVHVEEVDARIFLSFPLTLEDLERVKPHRLVAAESASDEEKRRLGETWGRRVASTRRLLEVGLYLHNALRHNAPLALYYAEKVHGRLPSPSEALEAARSLAELLREEAWRPEVRKESGVLAVYHRGADRRLSLYTMLALLETYSLLKMARSLVRDVDLNRGIPLSRVREDFAERIYEPGDELLAQDLALNGRMLCRDLDELEKAAKALREGCASLDKLLKGASASSEAGSGSGGGREGDEVRNFFAHSGFYKNFTELCRGEGGETLVKYRMDKDVFSKLRRWLRSPPRRRPCRASG